MPVRRTMKRNALPYIVLAAFAILALGVHQATAQQDVGSVVRMDPALDKLVAPGTKVEKAHGDFGFVEGPVWVRSGGYLVFSDIPRNSIMKWTPDGKVVALRTGIFPGAFPDGTLIGTNGLTLDRQRSEEHTSELQSLR